MTSTAGGSFSLEERNPSGLKQSLGLYFRNTILPAFLRFLGRVAPIWHLPGTNVVIVTSFDAFEEIYSRHFDFEVPYEKRVEILRWQHFILALQDTPEYHDMYDNITRLFKPSDTTRVQKIARDTTESILANSHGDLDFLQGLVKPVLLSIVEQHYGVKVPEEHSKAFFDGNLAGSGFLFSGPKITKKQAETATAAVDGVWPVFDAAMAEARAHPDPTTVLGRYYLEGLNKTFPEAKMRSALMTMVGGYLPTCANGSGRAMDLFLRTPDAMQYMQDAVEAQQDEIVLAGIKEALRANYIIPFLWRRATSDTYLGEGTTMRKAIRKDRILAVSLQAAMQDKRRIAKPKQFDPYRSPTVRPVYGHQFHYCIGARIADAVLLEVFRGVLERRPVQARSKNRWVGAYPWNIWVTLSEPGAAP
jgi:cytochrome P450